MKGSIIHANREGNTGRGLASCTHCRVGGRDLSGFPLHHRISQVLCFGGDRVIIGPGRTAVARITSVGGGGVINCGNQRAGGSLGLYPATLLDLSGATNDRSGGRCSAHLWGIGRLIVVHLLALGRNVGERIAVVVAVAVSLV